MYYTFYLILVSVAILLSSCIDRHHNPQLEKISTLIETDPMVALDSLAKINHGTLDTENRHYYDFLSIKASDKAYIPHKSDSLILSVIDYYSSDKNNPLYIESLYYAGRVYSDKGDKKTAFIYFQKALELLPEDTPYPHLRSHVLSQTGRFLSDVGLFEKSLPVIRDVIKINETRGDSVNLSFNHQLICDSFIHLEQYDSAEWHIKEAEKIATGFPTEHRASIRVYLAAIHMRKGDIWTALSLIRHTPDSIWNDSRPFALSYATEIYLEAGIPDTAYIYSKELINCDDTLNQKLGYRFLLLTPLERLIPRDSLQFYYSKYRNALESYYNNREKEAAILQYTQFNYDTHEQMRNKTEHDNEILKYFVVALSVLIVVAGIAILILKFKIKMQQIMLFKVLLIIKDLKLSLAFHKSVIQKYLSDSSESIVNTADSLSEPNTSESNKNSEKQHNDPNQKTLTQQDNLLDIENQLISANIKQRNLLNDIQDKLRSEMLALYVPGMLIPVPDIIKNSDEYYKLKEFIRLKQAVDEDSGFWLDLKRCVSLAAPMFIERLNILTGGKLKTKDLQTALLIKCGISHSQMSIIFGRTKGTISQRKETLSKKLFGNKVEMTILEQIIRLL